MEYIAFIVAALAFVLFVFVQGYFEEKKKQKYYKKHLRELKGNPPDKEYKIERFARISGYFEKHSDSFQIDDITWNDLGMDDIFKRMNYAISSTGDEYLYYMLRTPQFDASRLAHFDDLVEYYDSHEDERVEFMIQMHKLGNTGKFSLYDYIEYLDGLGNRSNRKDWLSILVLIILVIFSCFNLTIGIVAIVVWVLYQMFVYFKVKREIEPYLTSLAYMMRLINVAELVEKTLPEVAEWERQQIREAKKQLRKSRQGDFWVFTGNRAKTSGSPLDVIMDYIRMVFHIDLIYFNRMLGEVMQHLADMDILVSTMGYLEAAVSVGLYRASLSEGYCKPEFADEQLEIKDAYHPLIHNPIKNSIHTSKSVLLTGSNASGKSTFLKMLALNTLMAQTIYTVAALKYKAPYYHLYSSMSLKDDLEGGDSYYIVEIKAIKRILDASKQENGKILCFVDEVLRGTNTVERIAASTQILLSMTGENIQCFAATHDIELTHLLEGIYENYHFEEEIKDGDVLFNYLLKEGRATSRNAISLLEIMGYDAEIIQKAKKQADIFMHEGVWKRP